MASSASQAARAGRHAVAFPDLPQEVQREIFRHASRNDLVRLLRVSRQFRDLAAAELYRDFRILFPDEDNLQFDDPNDVLAAGFDTMVTSDYNYARHLRTICLDTLYLGDKAEQIYRPYLANLTCGKFMNTLLHLILRKGRALESFKWNIRVELSHAVYRELHQFSALAHFHIRMHAGPSQFQPPEPHPYNVVQSTPSLAPSHGHPPHSLPPPMPQPGLMPTPPPPPQFFVPASTAPPPLLPKPPRVRGPRRETPPEGPPTLSGFKGLQSLAVLDIDELDIIPELQACIRNCAGTLTKLKLSFSDALASLARKPEPEPEPEFESDLDDEYEPLAAPVPAAHPAPNHDADRAMAALALDERKVQEAVLGKILGVTPSPHKKPRKASRHGKEKQKKTDDTRAKTEQQFIAAMTSVTASLMTELSRTSKVEPSQEVIEMLGVAARKYMDEARSRGAKQENNQGGATTSSQSGGQPSSGAAAEESTQESGGPSTSFFGEAKASTKGKAKSVAKAPQGGVDPDEIDIEDPGEQLTMEPGDPSTTDEPANEPTPSAPASSSASAAARPTRGKTEFGKALVGSLEEQKAEFEALTAKLEMFELQADLLNKEIQQWRANDSSIDLPSLSQAESRLLSFRRSVRDMKTEIAACHNRLAKKSESKRFKGAGSADNDAQLRQMRDYLRETRGLALRSLSIYLIPVKASVLSRAVDLRALHRLTLLNVGNQAPIWALLCKENAEAPLPLRKISTDNVSFFFLALVSQLEEVHELFMLERDAKSKPESFAPRTRTTIDDIRKLVLKKHMPTLRRLMIKNFYDTIWDVNEKTILLMCRQGRKLEELACSMNVRSIHILMQHMAGLANLRALHIVQLRDEDTCHWVLRETKRFLADNVSHHPHLKLEWLSVNEDDRVMRLVRMHKGRRRDGDDKDPKGKGKAKDKGKWKGKGVQTAVVPVAASLTSASSSSPLPMEPIASPVESPTFDLDLSSMDLSKFLPKDLSEALGSSDEEDGDFGGDDGRYGQKIKLVDGLNFCDAEGVRIFKKEVVAGKL